MKEFLNLRGEVDVVLPIARGFTRGVAGCDCKDCGHTRAFVMRDDTMQCARCGHFHFQDNKLMKYLEPGAVRPKGKPVERHLGSVWRFALAVRCLREMMKKIR